MQQDVCISADGKEVVRTRCHVYSRVMGFIRPVQYFNTGKKSEFYSRLYYAPDTVTQQEYELQVDTNIVHFSMEQCMQTKPL